jgi:hypothetical protein
MAYTIQQEQLNSVLKADYVLWYGKEFRNLPHNTQHDLLENLCEWGFGEPPLGCNPKYLQNKEGCFMEYTITLSDGGIGLKPFKSLLPQKIKKYIKAYEEQQNKLFLSIFKKHIS